MGGVHGPAAAGRRGRVEIVLRSYIGRTGAAAGTSGDGRSHSWNKLKSKLIKRSVRITFFRVYESYVD